MTDSFSVTASDVDGNKIWVDIEVTDDDGLIVSDFSYGPAADQCFYEGAEVESVLRIPSGSAKALADQLGIYGVRALAARLGLLYQGKIDALRLIERQCADFGIVVDEHHWP